MSAEVDRQMEEYFTQMPFLELLGIESVTVDAGRATFRLPYDESLTNHTVVHGGVSATLVDATVAAAIHSDAEAPLDEMEPLTIEMDINYHAPVTDGEIIAEAELVTRGRTVAVGRAELRVDDELVATGTATYYQRWK